MNTLGLVIEREYTSRVKKKSFILLTILMPFLFVGLAFVPMWLSTIKDSGVKKIAVIDQTGLYAPDLKSSESSSLWAMRIPRIIKPSSATNFLPFCKLRAI